MSSYRTLTALLVFILTIAVGADSNAVEGRQDSTAFGEENPEGKFDTDIKYIGSRDGISSGQVYGAVTDIFYDSHNNEIYIVDNSNKRIVITDSEGGASYSFNFTAAKVRGSVSSIAVLSTGEIYLAQTAGRLSVLDYRGRFKREVKLPEGALEAFGGGSGGRVYSLDSDSRDYIYVGLYKRLIVLDPDDNVVLDIVSDDNSFISPREVVVDDKIIYVLDTALFSVFRYNKQGRLVSRFGKISGLPGGFSMPMDMAIDPTTGEIVVVDFNRVAVIYFNQSGAFTYEFGGPNTFQSPTQLAIDKRGRLFILDGASIKIFELVR